MMVFFNCNACGETMKKNQVEKHYQFKCRSCTVVSCVDCQKDFPGDSYKEHLKCISEEEKYSAKGFKPKANKGEQKQEAWTEHVVSAIESCKSNRSLRDLLIRIKDYPNIPRKKAKFENFLKNCAGVRAPGLVGQAWDVINTAAQKQSTPAETKETTEHPQSNGSVEVNDPEPAEQEEKKLSKRERKEERRKKQQKVEKKHKGPDENGDDTKARKKAKKRKLKDIEEEEEEEESAEAEETPKKKKKAKKMDAEEDESTEQTEDSPEAEKPDKFRWLPVALALLEKATDNEMQLKKFKKKMMSEFQARGGDGSTFTEEKLMRKFNKTIMHNPKFKIHKERIKLRH